MASTLVVLLQAGLQLFGTDLAGQQAQLQRRLKAYTTEGDAYLERLADRNMVVEVRANRMPGGALVVTFTDITPSVEAAEALERANATLEKRVRERTEQLQQANAELEAFAYSVAHDLRAPMTALDGFARLLSRDVKNLEPLHTHYLRRISDNVRHMSELTDALLSLSHLSAVDLVRRPVDLAVLARRVVEQLREADPDRIAEIEIAPALPTHGDERLLQQALANLLGNAWKFSRGKPVTRIRFGARMEAAGFVVYSVEDEGAGFDMRHAGNLFTAFHRMHSASEFEGTGIGLAIVRKVISRHGGRVWAESMPGEGTRVSFTLRPG